MLIYLSNQRKFTYFDAYATDTGFPTAGVGQENVLGFEIPVDDAFAVQDAHGCCNLLQEHSDGVLTESPLAGNDTHRSRGENKYQYRWVKAINFTVINCKHSEL